MCSIGAGIPFQWARSLSASRTGFGAFSLPPESIAGWSWSAEHGGYFASKLLVETPLPNLLMVGIYAATELFLGGVPTALHTADLAARIILGEKL
jgi:hypothetical protein